MAKKDTDLFDRLRQAGLRKQAATALSEVSEGAGKKAQRTARAAVKDLRALADEIEAASGHHAGVKRGCRQAPASAAHPPEYPAQHEALGRWEEQHRGSEVENAQFDPPGERREPLPSAVELTRSTRSNRPPVSQRAPSTPARPVSLSYGRDRALYGAPEGAAQAPVADAPSGTRASWTADSRVMQGT